jgi:hypothetical protein
MKKLLLILVLTIPFIGFGQSWEKTFALSWNNHGSSVQQTIDGGYIILGYTYIQGSTTTNSHYDVYLIKTDVNGIEQWHQTFNDTTNGGNGSDHAYSVQQTTDGGYIITGRVQHSSGWGPSGYSDVFLIKTDVNGIEQWNKNFGVTDHSSGQFVQQTIDGGYIICGQYGNNASTIPYQVYLIKTDVNGIEQWNQTFGGIDYENAWSCQQTIDGGYIICGGTGSNIGSDDVYLIKTDGYGIEQWNQTFGGTGSEDGFSVQQTTDGGYIITARTVSFGNGGTDVYLIKTDGYGIEQWTKTFGGTGEDYGRSVQQTTDGGYIIAGITNSFGNGNSDVYLIKTDGSGNELWSQTFGGTGNEYAVSVKQTTDGGYIICGDQNNLVYVIKTDSNGCVHTFSSQISTDCDTYSWNGQAYTSSGVYTFASTNSNGCDSTATLNLTINPSTTSTSNVTECDSYTWNGQTYTSTGVYTFVSTNSNGCDSTATLNLTINPSSISSVSVTECDTYIWNGTNYNATGTYSYQTTNLSGCDSTAILNLTINNSTTNTYIDTVCDSYIWSVNGVSYISSIIDTVIGVNSAGCTETNILNLTINNAFTSSILGNTQVSYLSTETYNVAQNIGSIFNWYLDNGGIIINGQTTNSIEVQWGGTSGTYELYVIETDIDGCIGDTIFYSVNVSNTTNVEDLNIDKLTIYPNPSKDVFNVEFTSLVSHDLEVRIINSIGEIVYIDNVNNHIGEYSTSISLEKYSKAIYFLEIQTDNGIVNKKLILQ